MCATRPRALSKLGMRCEPPALRRLESARMRRLRFSQATTTGHRRGRRPSTCGMRTRPSSCRSSLLAASNTRVTLLRWMVVRMRLTVEWRADAHHHLSRRNYDRPQGPTTRHGTGERRCLCTRPNLKNLRPARPQRQRGRVSRCSRKGLSRSQG
jgi:hypothetical protein